MAGRVDPEKKQKIEKALEDGNRRKLTDDQIAAEHPDLFPNRRHSVKNARRGWPSLRKVRRGPQPHNP